MTLKLDLSSDAEARLKDRAQQVGVAPEEYASKLLEETLRADAKDAMPQPDDKKRMPLGELFAQWEKEDATTDPKELEARQKDFDAFCKAMNENRSSYERKIYP
jgi:hypothetical protein